MRDIVTMNRLFFLALLMLPFNALPLYFLGSISSEGSFYPLLGLVTLVSINMARQGRILIFDRAVLIIMLLILVFSLISLSLNFSSIRNASYMGRFGLIRFFEQFFQLLLGLFISYSIAHCINSNRQLFNISKFIVIIMGFVVGFGIFQGISYFLGGVFGLLHTFIGGILFHDGIPEKMAALGRIHSVSQEPSLLSMYIAVMCPFVIGYSIKTKRYYHIVFMTIVLFLSYSRTGYVAFFLLAFLIFMLFKFGYLNISKFIYAIPVLILFVVIILFTPAITIFISLLDAADNGSNAARYAGVFSAIMLWLDNNIWFGLGLGQTGFQSADYLPAWGFISKEIQDVADGERWPFIHNLLIKILVENGIIGICLWLALFTNVLLKLNKINKINYFRKDPNAWIGYSAFASVVASILIMFNRELLSNMNIWISLGLALAYIKIHNKDKKMN